MLRKTVMLIALLVSLSNGQNAIAASAADARQFVDTVGRRVLDLLNTPNMSHDQKQQQLRQMFSSDVDMQWMGRFVLGRGWRQATDEQKQRYMDAYRQYLLARYTSNFADYTGSKYSITGVTHDADDQFTVEMKIKSSGQEPETNAGYRVQVEPNGEFKIVDIIIEGVSLITTQRADFASTLQQQGLDGLIGALQAKARSEQQASQSGQPMLIFSALTRLTMPALLHARIS